MIEIQNLEMMNKGSLIAKFNAKINRMGGLIIRECTLWEVNGRKWMNFPCRSYESEGKKKYFPYLGYEDKGVEDKFKEKIMEAVLLCIKKQDSGMSKKEEIYDDVGDLPF